MAVAVIDSTSTGPRSVQTLQHHFTDLTQWRVSSKVQLAISWFTVHYQFDSYGTLMSFWGWMLSNGWQRSAQIATVRQHFISGLLCLSSSYFLGCSSAWWSDINDPANSLRIWHHFSFLRGRSCTSNGNDFSKRTRRAAGQFATFTGA